MRGMRKPRGIEQRRDKMLARGRETCLLRKFDTKMSEKEREREEREK